jgi:hypothetical protein
MLLEQYMKTHLPMYLDPCVGGVILNKESKPEQREMGITIVTYQD